MCAACAACLVRSSSRSLPNNGQRQQFLTRWSDLDVGAHARAYATVVTRCPTAVIEFGLIEGVLPVVPQPLLVQPGVEVVPRQDLEFLTFSDGVPRKIYAVIRQSRRCTAGPALV